MSLTKAKLLDWAKQRFEWVEVPGVGKVGIQSVPKWLQAKRQATYTDPITGEVLHDEVAKMDAYALIDQVMEAEGKPLFDESDLGALMQLDAARLAPLLYAINQFNGGTEARGRPRADRATSGRIVGQWSTRLGLYDLRKTGNR